MDGALSNIYMAFDPNEAATADVYVDYAEARGQTNLARQFRKHLAGVAGAPGKYLCFLFTGHIGCGKSSELHHLCAEVKKSEPFQPGYLTVFLDAREYFDDFDVTMTDILLAIVTELANTLRKEIGYDLKDTYFRERFEEIKTFLLSDAELAKGGIDLPGLKLEVQRLRRSPEARQSVREKLKPQSKRMLEEINAVFKEARSAVAREKDSTGRQKYQDILLVFDNLEKMEKFENVEGGLASHRELFLERSAQLTGLQIHTIFTVPLRLVRSSDGPQLFQRYGHNPFVLPMVKVIKRPLPGQAREIYPNGVEAMRKMLSKRIGNQTLDEVFEPAALDFLLEYSGGHTRNLVSFVQNAATYADNLPISYKAARDAVKQSIGVYSASIPEYHWNKLAQLELSADQQIINGDEDYAKMLENLSVLEYRNGDDENSLESDAPWYVVNPLVRELRKFKSAVGKLQTEQTSQAAPEQLSSERIR